MGEKDRKMERQIEGERKKREHNSKSDRERE